MAESESSSSPVGFSGYLDKESKNSKWNKRFFVLDGGSLRYFKDDPAVGFVSLNMFVLLVFPVLLND